MTRLIGNPASLLFRSSEHSSTKGSIDAIFEKAVDPSYSIEEARATLASLMELPGDVIGCRSTHKSHACRI